MRHRKSGRPLGRNSAHRRALFRNMVTAFLEHERIETTEAKAKEIRSIAEQMISLGKRGDLHSRRLAASYLFDPGVVSHLFSDIAPRFSDRSGGYTRMFKTRIRKGDASQMAILELSKTEVAPKVESEEALKQAAGEEKKTKAKKETPKIGKEKPVAKKKVEKKTAVKKKTVSETPEKAKAEKKKKAEPKEKVAKKKKDPSA